MKRSIALILVVGLMAFISYGCGNGQSAEPPSAPEGYQPAIDPADFVPSIDNPYLPLTPGTTFIYEGNTGEGLEHIEVRVTEETRVVMGVRCVVVEDGVTIDGELAELTYDWYAQDKDGNVWYFGEDSKEYENGKAVSSAGSWEAGVDGAQPGIVMQAQPVVGEEYHQEYYEGEAEDMAEAVALDASQTVPTGSYTGCLKTKEWTPLEPSVVEFKYYAAGVGLILDTAGKDESQRIELIEIRTAS